MLEKKRIFGLDLLRAFAIIQVVLGHGSFLLSKSMFAGFPFIKMYDGVDLFFVLSGFLIGGIILKSINQSDFTSTQLLNFWKRRWFRTLPNYYLILLLNYLVVKYGIINEDIEQFNFHFLTFTHNFNSPFYGFFWESWSLSVEEWFYIFSPIFILFFLKIFSPKRAFFYTALLMIIGSLFYRMYLFIDDGDSYHFNFILRKTVLCRLDSIGYGLLASWIYYYKNSVWNSNKWIYFFSGILLLIFLLNFKSAYGSYYRQVFFLSLSSISFMLLLPLMNSFKALDGFIGRSITHISKISYSMYLINLALVAEVIRDNFAPVDGVDAVVKYMVFWLIVIVGSTLLYRFYEKPIMSLRDR